MDTPTRERMAPVIVRTYVDDDSFTADAATLAPLGYRVAARSSERGGLSIAGGTWAIVAVLLVIGGFVSPVLWIVAILFGLLASTGRRRMLKVTYQQG
jgi:hypothetical protein